MSIKLNCSDVSFNNFPGAQSTKPLNDLEGGVGTTTTAPPPPLTTSRAADPVAVIPPPTAPPPTASAAPPLLSQMYPSYLHYSAPPAAFYFPAQSYPYTDFVALPPPPNTPIGMPLGSLPFSSAGYYNSSATTLPPTKPATIEAPSPKKLSSNFTKPLGAKKPMPPEVGVKKPQLGKSMPHGGGSVTSSMTSSSSHVMTCDLCSLTFPSLSVLNNHIKGSRHLRKVKSQQAYKQMKAAGMSIKQQESGEIRCEVCRVSVNSSHQLQAHVAGM